MENSEILQQKMSNIDRGAYWCRILGTAFFVYGIVVLVLAGVSLLPLLSPRADNWIEVLQSAAKIVWGSVAYFVAAWLCRRASDAFQSIAALIRELGEIV